MYLTVHVGDSSQHSDWMIQNLELRLSVSLLLLYYYYCSAHGLCCNLSSNSAFIPPPSPPCGLYLSVCELCTALSVVKVSTQYSSCAVCSTLVSEVCRVLSAHSATLTTLWSVSVCELCTALSVVKVSTQYSSCAVCSTLVSEVCRVLSAHSATLTTLWSVSVCL